LEKENLPHVAILSIAYIAWLKIQPGRIQDRIKRLGHLFLVKPQLMKLLIGCHLSLVKLTLPSGYQKLGLVMIKNKKIFR